MRRQHCEGVETGDEWFDFDDFEAERRDADDYEASYLGWRRDEI